jgi:hypothetical protein
VGYGTGFVVRKHVVLTAAHVLFNDRDYAYVDQVRWFFQRERGEYDPPPQLPRGWYVFGGYAAQRQADNSPGVSSTASQNLDVGVLYFRDPAGRGGYCGYLVSEEAGSEWLELPFKMLLGYPVDTVAETNRGRMHYTPPADVAFSLVENRVFASTGIQSYPGNSGGPLCVLLSTNSNNFYYPAAIYIGGGTRSVVRAIDGAVAALINQAEMMADTGDTNYVGGGVPMAPSTGGASPFQPGYLRVELSPANAIAAGGGWRILGSGNTNYVNDNLARLPLLPATYTVEFRPAAGYQTPTNRPATVVAGSDVTTVLTVEYLPVQTVVAPHLAMGSNTFRLSIQGIPGARYQVVASSNLLDWEIVADNPNVTGGVWEFSDPGVSNRPLRFYRGRAP